MKFVYIEKTNFRVEEAKKAFHKEVAATGIKTSSAEFEAVSKDCEKYLKERHWRKRKIYSKLKGSHFFQGRIFEGPALEHERERPFLSLSYSQPDGSYPKIMFNKPLEKTEFHKPTGVVQFNLLSDLSSTSCSTSAKYDAVFKIGKTKDTCGAAEAKSVAYSKMLDDSRSKMPHIHFSKWEAGYLSKEFPGIAVANISEESSSASQTHVKSPICKSTLSSKPTWFNDKVPFKEKGAIKMVEKLLEMQRTRESRISSKVDNISFDDSASNSSKPLPDCVESSKSMHGNPTVGPSEPPNAIKKSLVRKVSSAPQPKTYKGFSSPGGTVSNTPTTQFPKATFSSPNLEGDLSPPPCVILNKHISPSQSPNSDNSPPHDIDLPIKDVAAENLKRDGKEKEPSEINENNDHTEKTEDELIADVPASQNEIIDSNESSSKSVSEMKSDDKENDSPNLSDLDVVQKILEDIQKDDLDEFITEPGASMKSSQKCQLGIPKSKKRKATKQPEIKLPAPKIRHYNRMEVVQYIEKQRTLRKKKLQEERHKKQQAEAAKKERLKHLFEQQKLAACKSKPLQPLKVRCLKNN